MIPDDGGPDGARSMEESARATVAPPGPEEAEVLAALRANDPSAFERVVRENLPWMLGVARRILSNEADAQEAVQDVFLSAFRGLPSFDAASRFSTWLHRITVNAALSHRRKWIAGWFQRRRASSYCLMASVQRPSSK